MIKIDVYDNAESARRVYKSFYELLVNDIPFPNNAVFSAFKNAFMERYPDAGGLELHEYKDEFYSKHIITDSFVNDFKSYGLIDQGADSKIVSGYEKEEQNYLCYKLAKEIILRAFEPLHDFLYSTNVNSNNECYVLKKSNEDDYSERIIINTYNLGILLCGYMDDVRLKSLRDDYDKERKTIEDNENKIRDRYKGSKLKRKRKKEREKLHLPAKKMLEYVFCYDRVTKNQVKTYAFVNSIGIRVCPYCNRNYVQVYITEKGEGDDNEFHTRPQLDHFWNRSMYPFLAISMGNLVPSCAVCNSVKHDKNNKILYPYKEGINDGYRFSINTIKSIAYMTKLHGCESDYELEFKKKSYGASTDYDERVKKSSETFGWNKLYESDKEYALKVYQNSYIFNEDFQWSIVKAMPDLFSSPEEVRRILNPKLVPKNRFNSEPLSKLTFDISEKASSDEKDILNEEVYEKIIGIKESKKINIKNIKIRSGIQTGVERAALDFARENRIATCGWCPKGDCADGYVKALDALDLFSETVMPETDTWQWTKLNLRDADAVLIIVPEGMDKVQSINLARKEAERLRKNTFIARGDKDISKIANWLEAILVARGNDTEFCVIGPNSSECPVSYRITMDLLKNVWKQLGKEIVSNKAQDNSKHK